MYKIQVSGRHNRQPTRKRKYGSRDPHGRRPDRSIVQCTIAIVYVELAFATGSQTKYILLDKGWLYVMY